MYVNIKNSSKELRRMLDRDGAVNQLEKDIQEVKESLENINIDAKKSWSENNPDSPKYIEDRTHYETGEGGVKQLDEKFIPDTIARKKDIENGASTWDNLKNKPFYVDNKATFSVEGDKLIATFEKPLNVGEQLWYHYNVPGVGAVKASSKGIAVWSSDTSKYRVSIGNKEMTDYGMMGYSTIGTNIMEISYASTNSYELPEFESLMVVKPISKEFLNTNTNINAGFNSIVDETSVSANNFGTSNVLSGDNSTTFGNSNKVQGKLSTVFGQNNTVIGNLSMFIGEKGNINGRSSFGVGSQIAINGDLGFGFGSHLSVSNDQFVIGNNNVYDAGAAFIIGRDGQNIFTVKNNGKVFIGEKELYPITKSNVESFENIHSNMQKEIDTSYEQIDLLNQKYDSLTKLSEEEKIQLASFESTGYDNTNSGHGSVQFGSLNYNDQENVVQLGRQNTTEYASGGYIYQIGFNNVSNQSQSYLFGRNLIGNDWEQVVIGKYNAESTALFIIGNGTSENRANALEIFKNNDAKFTGDIYSKGNKIASEVYVNEKITNLIDSAPETLNTLQELSKALGDDPNFATTISTELGETKQKIEEIKEEVKFDYENYPLPVLYLEGDITNMTKDDAVDLTYHWKDLQGTASVKWQGSSSLAYPKKNFTVKFDTKFEAKEGWGQRKKYVMKANWVDFTHSRNIVAAKIWGECIRQYEKYVYAPFSIKDLPNGGAVDGFPIVIVINGEYQGLYTFSTPKDGDLLGLDESNVNHCIIGASGVDDDMCGFVTLPLIDDADGFEYEHISDNATDADKAKFQTSLQNLYTALQNCDSRDKLMNDVGAHLELEKAVMYMVYCAHIGNYDGLTKNYLLWNSKISTKWNMSAYDLDSTFGNHPYADDYWYPGQFTYERLATTNVIFRKIYDYGKDLIVKWHDRMYMVKSNIVNKELYKYAQQIPKIYFDEEVKLWKDLPKTQTNNAAQVMSFITVENQLLEAEIEKLKTDSLKAIIEQNENNGETANISAINTIEYKDNIWGGQTAII